MPISRSIASLVLLLSLAVAGLGLGPGLFGVEPGDLVRLAGDGPDATIINAWPTKYCGC